VLFALLVVALIPGAVSPGLNAVAMLQIIFPVAFIFGSIYVSIDAIAVSLVVLPLSIKNVAVHMPELPLAMSLVILPFALVTSAIRPGLSAEAVTDVASPLTLIDCSILEPILFSFLQRQMLIISISSLLFIFFYIRVLASAYSTQLLSVEMLIECLTNTFKASSNESLAILKMMKSANMIIHFYICPDTYIFSLIVFSSRDLLISPIAHAVTGCQGGISTSTNSCLLIDFELVVSLISIAVAIRASRSHYIVYISI
jgi:hypothetical protein